MIITHLEPNEVFVFGSNAQGFHGAGSSGQAFRGDRANTWRTDEFFLAAMRSKPGSPERVGNWAIFGVAYGLQVGRNGMSYAVKTIERPGNEDRRR